MIDLDLLSLFPPTILVEYFDIIKHEKNIIPSEFSDLKLHSKGFYKQITVKDFPIRGLQVYLHIQRRRWIVIESQEHIQRN